MKPGVEPSLKDLVDDPLMDPLLAVDGLTRDDIWMAVEAARIRLGYTVNAPATAACAC
jgi:hypothetical protein